MHCDILAGRREEKEEKGNEATEERRGRGAGQVCAVCILFKEKNVKVADRLRLTLSGVKTKAERKERRGWTRLYLFVSMDEAGDD